MKNKLNFFLSVISIGLVAALLILLTPLFSGGTRCRGRDARVTADFSQIKTAAEKLYLEDNTYENINCNFGDIKILCDDIKDQSRNPVVIHTSRDNYCAYANLPVKHRYLCIGSNLKLIQTYINPGGAGYCDGETFICPKEEGVPPLLSLYEKIIGYFPLILISASVIGIILVFSISRRKNWRKQKIVGLIIVLLILVIMVIMLMPYLYPVRC